MHYRDLWKIAGTSEIRTSVEYYIENTGIEQVRKRDFFPYKWTNFKESYFSISRDIPNDCLLPRSPLDALEYFINIADFFPPTQTFRYQNILNRLTALEEDEEAMECLAAMTQYVNVIVHVEGIREFEQKYKDNGEEVFPLEPSQCFDTFEDYDKAFVPLGDYQYIYENGIGHVYWTEADGREAYEERIFILPPKQ